MYQTDRLTLGRSPSRFSEGQSQVLEKVVYKEDEQSQMVIGDLRARLDEALLRIVLMSIEVKALKLQAHKTKNQPQSFKVFENALVYENQTLKAEVERLHQMLKDKEKEILFVRDAEIRKSAIQTGEMSVRLGVLTKENQRLQNSQIEKINQLNNLSAQYHKLNQDRVTQLDHSTCQKKILELQQTVAQKEKEIYDLKVNYSKEITSKEEKLSLILNKLNQTELSIKKSDETEAKSHEMKQIIMVKDKELYDMKVNHSKECNMKDDTISSLRAKLTQSELNLKRLEESNAKAQTDFIEISRLKNAVGSLQMEIDSKSEKIARLEHQQRAVAVFKVD